MRTRRSRLAMIERDMATPLHEGYHMLVEITTQTPVLWFIGALAVLVILGPIPVWLFERTAENPDMDSYWVGRWWAVSAFSTIGHSGVSVETAGGQIVGSIYSVISSPSSSALELRPSARISSLAGVSRSGRSSIQLTTICSGSTNCL